MKRTLLLMVMMCCAATTMAQDSLSYKQSFRLLINAAFPVGEFNKTEFEDDYPDFARGGTMVTASYLRQVKSFLSAGASVQFRTNRFDMDKFASDGDQLVLERESDPWSSWFTMADVYLHSSRGGTGNFFLKGSAGASFNRSAYLNVQTVYGPIVLPADNATAFAWGYGAGVEGFYQGWGIVIELSRINTTPSFMGKGTNGKMIAYKQPMSSLNLGVGLSYNF